MRIEIFSGDEMTKKELQIKLNKQTITSALVVLLIIVLCYQNYSLSEQLIRTHQVPIYSKNWIDAMLWLRDNTPACTVIATYWDPGHFITEVARRPVIFDGASQNAKFTWEEQGILDVSEIKEKVGHDKFTFTYDYERNVTTITTARIQDVAITLLTSNESQALTILRRYLMPNCSSMYYLATGDLVGKSQWWSYFATWSRDVYSGTKYFYYPIALTKTQPLVRENAVVYVYAIGREASFLVYELDDSLELYYQQGERLGRVERFFYFVNFTGEMKSYDDAELRGMVWLAPDKSWLVYIPPELENSLFTRMFFFNGAGLEYFKLVKNFGGEVKVFRVDFD